MRFEQIGGGGDRPEVAREATAEDFTVTKLSVPIESYHLNQQIGHVLALPAGCGPCPSVGKPAVAPTARRARTLSAYLHPPVTASLLWVTALRVQEFDKGRGPVGFAPIGQSCDLPV